MATTEAIFAGCNRALRIFDHNSTTGCIAYGSQNTVQITTPLIVAGEYNSKVQSVLTLKNSNAIISAVRWIPEHQKLACSAQDGTVCIWSYNNLNEFTLDQCLTVSTHSISCIALPTQHLENKQDLCLIGDRLVFGDADGGLFVYSLINFKYEKSLETKLPFGFFAMTIAVLDIPESNEILAFIGGTKPTVHLVLFNLDTASGDVVASLPGHEDWVKSLAIRQIKHNEEKHFLVATGCLDRVIRLWKLILTPNNKPEQIETNKLKLLTSKEYKFKTQPYRGKIFIDAVLMGHDDWIGDLNWKSTDEMVLMSSSADSSIMLWTPDSESGVWFPDVRLGGVAIKGASTATGAVGGFYACSWIVQDDIEIVLTNGKTGSFRCWVKEIKESKHYEPNPCITGAYRDITDLSWSPNGEYLLSTSLDQTTRIHSKWLGGQWFEFGRPQIHGFDMISISSLNGTKFVSAGDEKVLRVFEMPKAFAEMLAKLTNFHLQGNQEQLPETATLPVLGLSNKADFDNTAAVEDQDANADESNEKEAFSTTLMNQLEGPPMEEVLQRYTLWPEIEKLYGHGFEITTLDVSPDESCVVSASRSNVAKHAGLRVFDTDRWLEHDQNGVKGGLLGHELTVTRLRFNGKVSGSGRVRSDIYVLAVSRDRKISLWKQIGPCQFELVEIVERAHSRIIWDCAWVETKETVSFVTISRDKEIKLWVLDVERNKLEVKAQHKFAKPATAVDSFAVGNGVFKLGVGLDNGDIKILEVDVKAFTFKEVGDIADNEKAGAAISRIKFSPRECVMAVGSRDSSLRIFTM